MFNKVFISYASEDFDYAKKVYNFLVERGLEPWMDKEKLLPGTNWDIMIKTELMRADFVLILLSQSSVRKRGYVQLEINLALEKRKEKLPTDTYIIPVKINRCEIPQSLSGLQWFDLSSNENLNVILEAIKIQQSVLIKDYTQKEISKDPLAFVDNRLEYCYGDRSPKQIVEARFPVLIDTSNQDLDELNTVFRKKALDTIIEARSNYFSYLKDLNVKDDDFMNGDSTSYCTISIHYLSEKFVSFTNFLSIYNTGAAHDYYGASAKNYILKPLRSFDFKELFSDYKSALMIFKEIVYNKLVLKAKTDFNIDDPTEFFSIGEMLQPEETYFENYYFKDNCIVFVYNPYEITPFVYRDHHVEISFDELLQAFPTEAKVKDFIIGLIAKD